MNIRYRYRHKETGEISEEILSLETIEQRNFAVITQKYEILSRDIGTGRKSSNDGPELFERDRVVWRIATRSEGIVIFDKGAFWVEFIKLEKDRLLIANCREEYFEIIGRE